MFVMRINGERYEVHIAPDGTKSYDPPLPQSEIDKGKRNIKSICDSRTAPGIQSDTTFHAGRGTLLQQMEGDVEYTKILTDAAKKQGYTPGANDVYIGQLADRKGDPKAFFKPGEGRSELKRRLEASGKGCEMPGLSVKPKPAPEKTGPRLNAKYANRLAKDYRERGEHSNLNNAELHQHIVKTHGR